MAYIICIAAMLFGVMPVGQAQAVKKYTLTLIPPFIGCGDYSDEPQETSGTGAYVYPSVSATNTTYCVIFKLKPLGIASNYVKTGDIEKKTFKYKSGYGGAGHDYWLYGYPTNTKFLRYSVKGKWKA